MVNELIEGAMDTKIHREHSDKGQGSRRYDYPASSAENGRRGKATKNAQDLPSMERKLPCCFRKIYASAASGAKAAME